MSRKLLEATIGKPAIDQIFRYCQEYDIQIKKRPEFKREIEAEFKDKVRSVIKSSMGEKLTPEEVLEISETQGESILEIIKLLGNLYYEEIIKGSSSGNDSEP